MSRYVKKGYGGESFMEFQPLDAHCLLRPEAIEAWFYLYRFTGENYAQLICDSLCPLNHNAHIAS